MKTLKDELKELQILLNNPTPENEMLYQKKFIEIKNKFSSKEDANIIADFILNGYKQIDEGLKEIEKEISIRQQLEEVKEVISLSYIAKKYFGKSRQWLNNRINGCIVNGKPCKFSEEEKENRWRRRHGLPPKPTKKDNIVVDTLDDIDPNDYL